MSHSHHDFGTSDYLRCCYIANSVGLLDIATRRQLDSLSRPGYETWSDIMARELGRTPNSLRRMHEFLCDLVGMAPDVALEHLFGLPPDDRRGSAAWKCPN